MCTIWAEMLPLNPSDLALDWYDLDRGVAHLGRGVAQLGQVLTFLAEVIVPLLAEVLLLADVITRRKGNPDFSRLHFSLNVANGTSPRRGSVGPRPRPGWCPTCHVFVGLGLALTLTFEELCEWYFNK
ncbi:hypothetical protein LOK49_Contig16G00003, partial [Camellia lanceoleosa]